MNTLINNTPLLFGLGIPLGIAWIFLWAKISTLMQDDFIACAIVTAGIFAPLWAPLIYVGLR